MSEIARPLTKEEIASWYLSAKTKITETMLISYGFCVYAHVVINASFLHCEFDIYNRVLFNNEDFKLDARFSAFDGYAAVFLLDKRSNVCKPTYEYFGSAIGKDFKKFLRHRVIPAQQALQTNIPLKQLPKSWMFEGDFHKIRLYQSN